MHPTRPDAKVLSRPAVEMVKSSHGPPPASTIDDAASLAPPFARCFMLTFMLSPTTPAVRLLVTPLALLVGFTALPAAADLAADQQAIRESSRRYKEALDRGDGKALAAIWMADGDIVDAVGNVLKGRDTVEVLEPPAAGTPANARPEFTI